MVGSECLQISDCHLQNVRLFQLRVSRSLIIGLQDEGFELVQAVVDSSSAFLLHDRLVALSLERLLAHLFHLHGCVSV